MPAIPTTSPTFVTAGDLSSRMPASADAASFGVSTYSIVKVRFPLSARISATVGRV